MRKLNFFTVRFLYYQSALVTEVKFLFVIFSLNSLIWVALRRAGCFVVSKAQRAYLELVYLVTALVPSETACLASSPGRRSLTEVWISREVMVDLLL